MALDRMFEFAQSFLAMSLRNIAHISMSETLSSQVMKVSKHAAEVSMQAAQPRAARAKPRAVFDRKH
jgi:hypothetical protein